MRLLVTGASGLLGLNLCLVAVRQGHHVTGLVHTRNLKGVPFTVRQMDLSDETQAESLIDDVRPEAVIHCAALADLDAAEREPDKAQKLNVTIPAILARSAQKHHLPFLQISSDAVFNGQRGGYAEDDPIDPLSVYAQSKRMGELAVASVHRTAVIARTVFYGWSLSGTRSLAEFFVNHLSAGQAVKGFTDVLFCPLYVEDLAETLLEMMNLACRGMYHVVATEAISKFDFGVQLAEAFGFDPDLIIPTRAAGIARDARRSLNLTLKNEKLLSVLGHPLPSIQQGIERLHQRWLEGYPQVLHSYY